MPIDRPGGGDQPGERGEQPERPERPEVSPVDRSLSGDTAREIWAATVDRFQDRAGQRAEETESRTVEATDRPSNPDPSSVTGRARSDQPGDRPETRDWRGAVEATTPELAKGMLANRTYGARIDIAVEDAKGIPAERSGVDRSLADRWVRFGDARDDKASDEDIAAAYERQVKRDGPPEAEAAYRVGRERVVEAEGQGGLRTPGKLDKAIGEASEQILTVRGFRVSAEQPAEQPSRSVPDATESADRAERRDRAERMRDEVELPEKVRELPRASDVLPNLNRAEIDGRKFADYSMRLEHPQNGGKANGWRALGYDVDDPDARLEAARDLTDLIGHELLKDGKVADTDQTPYGPTYRVLNGFIGPNGRHATLVTGWQVVDEGERGYPRLATVWVQPHKDKEGRG